MAVLLGSGRGGFWGINKQKWVGLCWLGVGGGREMGGERRGYVSSYSTLSTAHAVRGYHFGRGRGDGAVDYKGSGSASQQAGGGANAMAHDARLHRGNDSVKG